MSGGRSETPDLSENRETRSRETRSRETQRNVELQTATDVLMVRPSAFSCNEVTRPSNRFQQRDDNVEPRTVHRAAVAEFNAVVATLVARGIGVHLFEGRTSEMLPDEVFTNNWLTTHTDGTVVLYPLLAWNRRMERRRDILAELQHGNRGFKISQIIDLTILEQRNHFLEGTGSMVLDRPRRTLYACHSPRTSVQAIHVFTKKMDYAPVIFTATDATGQALYHTNVMMTVGEGFALVCLEAIADVKERYRVMKRLEESGREIVQISVAQMLAFAGNALQLRGSDGSVIVISTTAVDSLDTTQRATLDRHGEVVPVNVRTIERYGGGGVRCMLTEIFLPRSNA